MAPALRTCGFPMPPASVPQGDVYRHGVRSSGSRPTPAEAPAWPLLAKRERGSAPGLRAIPPMDRAPARASLPPGRRRATSRNRVPPSAAFEGRTHASRGEAAGTPSTTSRPRFLPNGRARASRGEAAGAPALAGGSIALRRIRVEGPGNSVAPVNDAVVEQDGIEGDLAVGRGCPPVAGAHGLRPVAARYSGLRQSTG